jgi:hypothetical protein
MILVAVAVVVGSLTFARDAQSPTPAEDRCGKWTFIERNEPEG